MCTITCSQFQSTLQRYLIYLLSRHSSRRLLPFLRVFLLWNRLGRRENTMRWRIKIIEIVQIEKENEKIAILCVVCCKCVNFTSLWLVSADENIQNKNIFIEICTLDSVIASKNLTKNYHKSNRNPLQVQK